jgi:hypothetical protein
LLARSELVAIDAFSAKLQGFEPLSLPFIRLAHERGLGIDDPNAVEVVGIDIGGINFGFHADEDTLGSGIRSSAASASGCETNQMGPALR